MQSVFLPLHRCDLLLQSVGIRGPCAVSTREHTQIELAQLVLEAMVLLGTLRLPLERPLLSLELAQDVLHPEQVLRVRSILRSAAMRRLRKRVTPAASSMKSRRSSGFAFTICSMRPCSMIAYARVPTPVPRKSSVMSFNRHGTRLMKYSDSPERKYRRRHEHLARLRELGRQGIPAAVDRRPPRSRARKSALARARGAATPRPCRGGRGLRCRCR